MIATGNIKVTMQLNNYSHVHIQIATYTIKSGLFPCVSGKQQGKKRSTLAWPQVVGRGAGADHPAMILRHAETQLLFQLASLISILRTQYLSVWTVVFME